MPDVSVVIPTRERWPALERTLAALGRQELGGLRMEVVVADNGSRDGSLERLRAASFAFDLRIVEAEVPGAAAARNAGLCAARSPLLLFLGDDCRPAGADFVAGHVRAHDERGHVVVGRTDWDPAAGVTPVMRWLAHSGKMLDFREPLGPEQVYTGNCSVARAALIEIGAFDERFRGYGWEDVDLGLRLADAGVHPLYRPDLLAHHEHRYTLLDSLERMRAVGRGASLLRRIHAHREPSPGPGSGRLKLAAARTLAPLATRVPERLASERLLQAAHLSALAQGEAEEPLPDDPALRGWPVPEGSDPSDPSSAHAGSEGSDPSDPGRPGVSVVVPFYGDRGDAERLVGALEALRLRDGDEVVVADNTPEGVLESEGPVRAVPAREEQSSYYARNVGAEASAGEWLLFVDSDCTPRAGLLDDYFRGPIDERCGAVAGNVLADSRQDGLIARYARSRTHLSQAAHFRDAWRPYAITANLLIRRAAWADVGGFYEGLRSGGDADICWRMQDAGWTLAYREHAAVEHRHRESIRGLVRQAARYSAAIAWMDRHHPGSGPRPKLARRLVRSAAGVAGWTLLLKPQRALFKAIDAIVVAADAGGFVFSNNARRPDPAPGDLDVVVMADSYPELSETFIAAEVKALLRAGHRVRVEAPVRARRPARDAARGVRVDWREDDGIARMLADLAWLAGRHPLRCAQDLLARRRWRREEDPRPLRALAPLAGRLRRVGGRHLHAHFAAGAALDALRLSRLLGIPYSVTAHAYDIYMLPANLREKLERASFATSGCDYTVRDLREVAPAASERIHEVIMGVDGERFRRGVPHPAGRTVVAVGRLVEKKGFEYLIEAAALLRERAPLERVLIAGDGPLRPRLESLIAEHGLTGAVVLVGALDPPSVRDLLERADLLAMPCVIAGDGDRDSMPVVVKEALAMEVPVVASDEVGLPELVRPEWGRLVPPRDAAALAAAIEEVLALEPAKRAAMGRAGREFVTARCDVDAETAKLARLIAARDPG